MMGAVHLLNEDMAKKPCSNRWRKSCVEVTQLARALQLRKRHAMECVLPTSPCPKHNPAAQAAI